MKISKEGKIDMFDRATLEVMNEFSFDMETMADEIIDLREQLDAVEECNDL